MPFIFNKCLDHFERGVPNYHLSTSGAYPGGGSGGTNPGSGVTGDFIHIKPSTGVGLDTSLSSSVAMTITDLNNHVATANGSYVGYAPRVHQYGANGQAALNFSGINQAMSFDSGTLSVGQNVPGISVVQVIKPDGYDSTQTTGIPTLFISTNNGGATTRFSTSLVGTNALQMAARRLEANGTQSGLSANNVYSNNEAFVWTCIADFVGDGTNSTFTMYKNNTALSLTPSSTTLGSGNTNNTASVNVYLGGVIANNLYAKYTQGEIYVYPRALSNADRTAVVSNLMTTHELTNIQILSPTNYASFQRSSSNTASIPISGIYSGTPTAIEASFNGSAYQTIVSNPSGGTFSGTLTGASTGQGILTVRFTNDTTQYSKKFRILVGDVFVLTGQSNQTDVLDPNYALETAKTYTMANGMGANVFNSRYSFAKWFDVNHMQTWIVNHAQDYYNTHGYPCAYVMASIGGTSSAKWRADNTTDTYGGSTISLQPGDNFGVGLSLYARAKSMIQTAIGTGVTPFRILHGQGEADAGGSVSQATYLSNITNTFSQFNTDFPGVRVLPSLVQVIKDNSGNVITTTNVNNAIQQAWTTLSYVSPGADLTAVQCDYRSVDSGSFHMLSDTNNNAQSAAWVKASGTEAGYKPVADGLSLGSAYPMYSVARKLRAAYSGPAINVTRADGQTSDIGFTSQGILNTSALLTFAAASTTTGPVTVNTVYDQGTLVAHLVSPTTAAQPTIATYANSTYSVNLQNGTPYLQFNQSGNFMDMTASTGQGIFANVASAYVAFCGAEAQDNDNTGTAPFQGLRTVIGVSTASGTSRVSLNVMNYNNNANNCFIGTVRSTDSGASSNNYNTTTTYINNVPFTLHQAVNFTGQTTTLYYNNAALTLNQAALTTAANNTGSGASTIVRLGRNFTNSADSKMRFGELMLIPQIPTDQDRIVLARSQGSFYGVTVA